MYTWTLLAITIGVIVIVFQILLFLGLFIKVRKRKDDCVVENPKNEKPSSGKTMCVTDPSSGKLVNLERVSNASSLRSTRSVGFISYDGRSEGSLSRGRVTPVLFGTGSYSAKTNRSMSLSTHSIDKDFKTVNVNPLFKEEVPAACPQKKTSKIRAREI